MPEQVACQREAGFAVALTIGLVMAAFPLHAADGDYDPDWGQGGRLLLASTPGSALATVGFETTALRPTLHANGRITLGGTCLAGMQGKPCAVQVKPDGSADTAYGISGVGTVVLASMPGDNRMFASTGMPDGSLVLGGRGPGGLARLARITSQGVPDAGVGSGSGYADFSFRRPDGIPSSLSVVTALHALADGKLLVAGAARNAAGNLDFAIARLDANLSPDPAFGSGGTRFAAFDLSTSKDDFARAIAVDRHSRIVVAGHTDDVSSPSHRGLALRLDADGMLDPTFAGTGQIAYTGLADGDISFSAVVIDAQDRPLLAGSYRGLGNNDAFIVRMRTNGSTDSTFNGGARTISFDIGGDRRDETTAIALQTDGRILVGGMARMSGDAFRFTVSRLLANGAIDTGFGIAGHATGTFQPPPTAATDDRQPTFAFGNGGLMVAGRGLESGTTFRFGIAKLQLDSLFANGFE